MPMLQSHTHCQAAQTSRTSQSLSISVSFPPHGRKKARLHNSVYVTIAGEVVNRRSVLLRNFVLNGQESASKSLLLIRVPRVTNGRKSLRNCT